MGVVKGLLVIDVARLMLCFQFNLLTLASPAVGICKIISIYLMLYNKIQRYCIQKNQPKVSNVSIFVCNSFGCVSIKGLILLSTSSCDVE